LKGDDWMTIDLEDCSVNLRRYLKLYKKHKRATDENEQDIFLEKMEDLYYELDDDDLSFVELHGLC
jgi:hypothetical protein